MLKVGQPIVAGNICGLCNRLMPVVCGLRIANILCRPFHLWWPTNQRHCDVSFNQLFTNRLHVAPDCPSGSITSMFETKLPGEGDIDLSPYFARLKLVTAITDLIDDYHQQHGFKKLIGIHVRKTDKFPEAYVNLHGAIRILIDQQYEEVMKIIVAETDYSFYLSTDDMEVVSRMRRLFGDRVLWRERTASLTARNYDSAVQALTDLYLLAKTRAIIYGIGSFGWLAPKIHNVPAMNVVMGSNVCCMFARSNIRLPSPEDVAMLFLNKLTMIDYE
jgi:hypothetical protein